MRLARLRRRSTTLWIGLALAALLVGVVREWHRGRPDGAFSTRANFAHARGAQRDRDRVRARGGSGTGVPDLVVGVAVIALGVVALRAGAADGS